MQIILCVNIFLTLMSIWFKLNYKITCRCIFYITDLTDITAKDEKYIQFRF